MNFLLGIGRFWESGDTGVAGIALELGVWLEKNVILKCAGLYQVLRRGCLVVCRKLVNFLVIFCGFSAEICGKRSEKLVITAVVPGESLAVSLSEVSGLLVWFLGRFDSGGGG